MRWARALMVVAAMCAGSRAAAQVPGPLFSIDGVDALTYRSTVRVAGRPDAILVTYRGGAVVLDPEGGLLSSLAIDGMPGNPEAWLDGFVVDVGDRALRVAADGRVVWNRPWPVPDWEPDPRRVDDDVLDGRIVVTPSTAVRLASLGYTTRLAGDYDAWLHVLHASSVDQRGFGNAYAPVFWDGSRVYWDSSVDVVTSYWDGTHIGVVWVELGDEPATTRMQLVRLRPDGSAVDTVPATLVVGSPDEASEGEPRLRTWLLEANVHEGVVHVLHGQGDVLRVVAFDTGLTWTRPMDLAWPHTGAHAVAAFPAKGGYLVLFAQDHTEVVATWLDESGVGPPVPLLTVGGSYHWGAARVCERLFVVALDDPGAETFGLQARFVSFPNEADVPMSADCRRTSADAGTPGPGGAPAVSGCACTIQAAARAPGGWLALFGALAAARARRPRRRSWRSRR